MNLGKYTESQLLKELKKLRKIADYEPFTFLTINQVNESVNLMKEILEATIWS